MSLSMGSKLNLTTPKITSPVWRRNILDAMQTRVDSAIRHPLTVPTQAGGWCHQYVCPEHELALIFDTASPTAHRCPRGDSCQGAAYDAAFRVFAHRHYAAMARDAAVLYRATSENRYLKASFEILSHYAISYEHFDGGKDSKPWMLTGKAFNQALTEAIWAVPLAQAFEILRPVLSSSQVDLVTNHLLYPIAEVLIKAHEKLVIKQGRLESNYNAWLITAMGCLGFALGDDTLIESAIHGPGGFSAHLNAAVLPDGFEYEVSPYYHNFVAWAYTLLAETARSQDVDLYSIQGKEGQSIQQMWSALASIVWPDGSIPHLHDGNYWQNSSFDAEFCEVYEVALARTGDSRYAWLLDCAYQRSGAGRDSWAALMFADRALSSNPRPVLKSTCLENIGLAVLHASTRSDELAALIRFGPYGGNHTHLDCLALLLFPCSLDAGNPPYGADTRRSWYQQSAAHNVVMVDGESQAPSDGQLLSWIVAPDRSAVKAAADGAYPGVKFSRQVAFERDRIVDRASLSSDDGHIYDWLLHTDVALNCEDKQLTPVQGTLFPEGAGSYIRLVWRGICSDALQAVFEHNRQMYRLTLSASSPMEIFLGRSPQRGGINMDGRHTLVARVQGWWADFHAIYEVI